MNKLEDPGPGGGATARRTLVELYAQRPKAVTRAVRSRQLPTNEHHAALRAWRRVTREYQNDRPSKPPSPSGPGSSRDGPVVSNDVIDSARPYQSYIASPPGLPKHQTVLEGFDRAGPDLVPCLDWAASGRAHYPPTVMNRS